MCYKLVGEVLVVKGGMVLFDKGYGMVVLGGGVVYKVGECWWLVLISK